MRAAYFLILIRIAIGLVYVISGAEKLLQPYENFLYIIEGYDMIPYTGIQCVIAWLFPWLEYLLGGLLVLGLWTKQGLISVSVFSVMFIVVVGQAIVRKLPLTECGCFGDLVDMPLTATLFIDILLFLLVILLLYFYDHGVSSWAIDRYWIKREGSDDAQKN